MSKSNIKKKIADGQLLPGVFVSLGMFTELEKKKKTFLDRQHCC